MDFESRKDKEDKKRKEMNANILKRLKAGDALQEPANLTWFPPRPVIQKNKDAVKALYGDDAKIIGDTNLKIVDKDKGES